MAAIHAIVKALRRAVGRDLQTFSSIKVNNFFLFVMLLVYGALESGLEPKSAEPLLLLLGVLVLLPASSDPLAKIPPSRMALWPLRPLQRAALRIASALLSPVLWLVVFGLWKTARLSVAAGFVILVVTMQFWKGLRKSGSWLNPWRLVPQLPGPLGGLVRNHLRQISSLLDFYVALALSLGGIAYRYLGRSPDPAAPAIISLLIALALSTSAQSLFGLELKGVTTRYGLLPLKGWQILFAKDAAFLSVLILLIAPPQVGPGLTFGFAALALGHHSSVHRPVLYKKWRFAAGRLLPIGALQAFGGFALGFAEISFGARVFVPVVVLWSVSVYGYGRTLDRGPL